jgi:hypothetical protein
MGIASLTIPAPIGRREPPQARDYGRRDRAVELFDERRYREAIAETFAYVIPGVAVPDLEREALCLVQGSARVRARIDGAALVVSATLAALDPAAPRPIAALRYALARLSATGQIFQPRLDAGVLRLEFREALELVHPLKLVEVMQRLPAEAERNDAWLADRFGLVMTDREALVGLDAAELERAKAVWAQHWQTVEGLMTESKRRRSIYFFDALGAFALNGVRYALPLFGAVRAQLNELADVFTDGDEDPDRREAALGKCIKAMKRVDDATLARCVGHARYAINPLAPGSPALLSALLGGGPRLSGAGELRATGRSIEAALGLVALYVLLLAQYAWAPEVETALRGGLDAVAGKPWRDAADLLWAHAHRTSTRHGAASERAREEPALA